MSVVVWTGLVVVGVLLCLVAHELMHAVALNRIGVHARRAGVGFFWPRWRVGTLGFGPKPTEVFVSPWLLGAWVSHEDTPEARERIEAARWRDFAWYAGAGVWINAVIGSALLGAAAVLDERPVNAAVFGCAAVVVALLGDRFTAYVAPLMWPVAVGVFVWGVADSANSVATGDGQAVGIVGVARLLVAHNPQQAVALTGAMSLALALTNMAPFPPLDGGLMFERLLRIWRVPRRVTAAIGWIGLVVVVGFFVLSEATDILFW